MNKLKILRTAVKRPNSGKKYKETFNFVAFHSKVNIRRKLRPKGTKFGNYLDLEHDFSGTELEAYEGPALEAGQPITQPWIDSMQKFFVYGGHLHRKYVYRILTLAEAHYRHEPLLVDITLSPEAVINICGDIHGQLFDLIKIFKLQGPPTPTNLYLFNGDIVDKGSCSIECLLLLLVYKLAYPKSVLINRGNHESAIVNVRHGFHKEISRKYPEDFFLFEFIGEVFKWMPVAHLIQRKIFIVHGGLPDIPGLTIDDIRNKKAPVEAQDDDVIAGLLWSDPVARDGIFPSTRGIGVFFGPDVTKRFLEQNDLKCIVRSHAEVKSGCGLSHTGCYTVFSAPCEDKGIMGGLIMLKGDTLDLQGNVFTECCREEAVAFVEGQTEYKKAPPTAVAKAASIEEKVK